MTEVIEWVDGSTTCKQCGSQNVRKLTLLTSESWYCPSCEEGTEQMPITSTEEEPAEEELTDEDTQEMLIPFFSSVEESRQRAWDAWVESYKIWLKGRTRAVK